MTSTVTFDADQEEIRGVARSFLQARFPTPRVRELSETDAGFEAETWNEIAELGWAGIAVPESHGGAGYGAAERCLVMQEMGRVLAPVPYLSSAVLAADALAAAGTDASGNLLASVADGSARLALVAGGDLCGHASLAGGVEAAQGPDGYTLAGSGGIVVDGATATLLVVAARADDGLGLFVVDPASSAVARRPAPMVDATRRFADVAFTGAAAERVDSGQDMTALLRAAFDASAVALAAEMVGGAERCLDMTLEYVKDRRQFGVPIGSFQAVKHRLADLAVGVEAARESVYMAADVLDSGDGESVPQVCAMAKSAASDVYVHATTETIQLHGGIGFTWEHDAHLYYKRALVTARMCGTAAEHRDRIAVSLGT
jgi:alkylation response protein AidB-like acyl-CoA dehydrogenase